MHIIIHLPFKDGNHEDDGDVVDDDVEHDGCEDVGEDDDDVDNSRGHGLDGCCDVLNYARDFFHGALRACHNV